MSRHMVEQNLLVQLKRKDSIYVNYGPLRLPVVFDKFTTKPRPSGDKAVAFDFFTDRDPRATSWRLCSIVFNDDHNIALKNKTWPLSMQLATFDENGIVYDSDGSVLEGSLQASCDKLFDKHGYDLITTAYTQELCNELNKFPDVYNFRLAQCNVVGSHSRLFMTADMLDDKGRHYAGLGIAVISHDSKITIQTYDAYAALTYDNETAVVIDQFNIVNEERIMSPIRNEHCESVKPYVVSQKVSEMDLSLGFAMLYAVIPGVPPQIKNDLARRLLNGSSRT